MSQVVKVLGGLCTCCQRLVLLVRKFSQPCVQLLMRREQGKDTYGIQEVRGR